MVESHLETQIQSLESRLSTLEEQYLNIQQSLNNPNKIVKTLFKSDYAKTFTNRALKRLLVLLIVVVSLQIWMYYQFGV